MRDQSSLHSLRGWLLLHRRRNVSCLSLHIHPLFLDRPRPDCPRSRFSIHNSVGRCPIPVDRSRTNPVPFRHAVDWQAIHPNTVAIVPFPLLPSLIYRMCTRRRSRSQWRSHSCGRYLNGGQIRSSCRGRERRNRRR